MANISRPHVLMVGTPAAPEFAEPLAGLRAIAQVEAVPTVAEGLKAVIHSLPDYLILAQVRPGQFSETQINRLLAAAPLARCAALLGSWCEGETRTGQPWPGVERFYWHQFSAGVLVDWMASASTRLPRTATAAERVLHAAHLVDRRGLILIHSPDRLTYETLGEALWAAGYATVRVQDGRRHETHGAQAGLWDCRVGVRQEKAELAEFVESLAPAPVLVLASFPRRSDQLAAQQAGARGLVSKPFLTTSLLHELDQYRDVEAGVRPPHWSPTRHVQLANRPLE